VSGGILDVCVDVRDGSPTFGQWHGEMLENGVALYVPKGCAHGFLSLTDDTWVLYFSTEFYTPEAECGCRFDEPLFGINWPLPGPYIMTDKDKGWGLLS